VIRRITIGFAEWCSEVINGDEYAFIDTETTGLQRSDQIIELAIVATSGQVLYNKLLQPSCPISESAMNTHRITEAMVAEAKCFREEWPEIEAAIGGRIVISWNWKFDERMLKQSAAAHRIEWPFINGECAMLGYTEYYSLQKWEKLQDACTREGIDFLQDHRALSDTFATLQVIRAVAKKRRE
jgi:DNA polymerase III epsilon subunit-like protein